MICTCGCGKEIEPERLTRQGGRLIQFRVECSERRRKERDLLRKKSNPDPEETIGTQPRYEWYLKGYFHEENVDLGCSNVKFYREKE